MTGTPENSFGRQSFVQNGGGTPNGGQLARYSVDTDLQESTWTSGSTSTMSGSTEEPQGSMTKGKKNEKKEKKPKKEKKAPSPAKQSARTPSPAKSAKSKGSFKSKWKHRDEPTEA